MKKLFTILFLFTAFLVKAQYSTPGTGVNWTLDDLVTNSGGVVTGSNDNYQITNTLTILPADQVNILGNVTVLFHSLASIVSEGTLIINAPVQSVFTALDTTLTDNRWRGFKLVEGHVTHIKNATFSFGGGLRVQSGTFTVDGSTFYKNFYKSSSANGSYTSSAVLDVSGYVSVTNNSFILNQRGAIASATNASCAANIRNNYMFGNTTENTNRPQINMGPAGAGDTTFIVGNTVIGNGYTRVGGIAYSCLIGGTGSVVIDSNFVDQNRYGITLTGTPINGAIRYNTITNNNIENNPALGGSGINFTASSASANQTAMVTGNIISGNLWGITIIGYAKINMGDSSPATFNPGGNVFSNNSNADMVCDLYNNGPVNQSAMYNCWSVATQDSASIETVVMHVVDDATLGRVNFMPSCALYQLTFNVKNSASEPLEGVSINLEGQTTNLTTNAQGVASTELYGGTYAYTATLEGYYPASGTVQINSANASVNIVMGLESAFGNVVATEINNNKVEVDWSSSGGGTGPGGGTVEDFFEGFEAGTVPTGWVIYDVDGDGYKWENTAANYDVFDAHTGDYCMTSASYVNNVGALNPNNWLVTPPLAITATSELKFWVDGQDANYAAEKYYVKVSTTGNLVANFTTTLHTAVATANWSEVVLDLSAYVGQTIHIAFQHNGTSDLYFLKLDDVTVTNTVTRSAYTTPVAPIASAGLPFRTSGMTEEMIQAKIAEFAKADATRDFIGFNVYRTSCVTGDLTFLGMTTDSSFTDHSWGGVEPGSYKWGVVAVSDEGQSEIDFSNCLDKNMTAQVSVKVTTNSGDSPEGTQVTFTNTSEPELGLVYNVTLDATGYFKWEEFRKGTYDILVQNNAFAIIEITGEIIEGPKNYVWLLEELLTPVADLHVSVTGYATWNNGGGGGAVTFEPFMEDFSEGIDAWTRIPATANWQLSETNRAGGDSPEVRFYWSPNTTNRFYFISPMMNTLSQTEIEMSFDHLIDDFGGGYTLQLVAIADGVEHMVTDFPASTIPATNVVTMLTEAHGVGAEEFQIAFVYEGAAWDVNMWNIDNIALYTPGTRALNYYKVWLDGIFVSNTPNNFYQYNTATLTPGQEYLSEVAAIYSNGMSAKMSYTWTYVPCDSFPSPQDLSYEIINETDVKLSWAGGDTPPPPPPGDGFSDDFESYTNFAIDFAPWTNVDVDGSGTYGMNGIDWLNEYAAQAFIVFNPSATSGPLPDTPAHSGNKFLACFASEVAPNNDWVMSPKVTIGAGYKVSFWAKSYTADYGLERFKVGVSTTGLLPANFTIISPGSYVSAPAGDWTLFTYDLAAYVGQDIHVGINCVSNDAFFLMIDDFSIGATTKEFASNSTSPVIGSGITGTRETRTQMEQNAVANADPVRAQLLIDSQNYSGATTMDRAADILWGANWEDPQASENGIVSTYFGGISAPTYTADDFVVPAGKSWVVSSLWARGFVSAGLPAPQGFGYTIFADANGKPGAVLHEKTNAGANNPDLVKIDLETPVTLTEGKYWVSIYAYYATATGTAQGRWNQYMWNPSPAVENPAMLSDLANLFGGTNGFESLISLGVAYSALDFAVVGEETGGGSGGGEIPEGVIGANVYRDGLLIAEMVQGTTYTDAGVEPGVYDYCVTFVYEGNAESCAGASCVEVSLEEDCIAPVNLTAELSTDKTKIILEWNKDNFEGAYLSYGSLTYSDAIGVGGAALTAAIQLDPAMLAPYDGRVFSKIKMYYGTGPIGNVTIQIWEGTTLVREQAITGTIIGEAWNEFTFNQPLLIDGTKSYKVGYTVANYSADGFPGGAQDYMGNPNSDVIFFNGAWDHLNNYLPYSWLIEAYVSSAGKEAYDDVVLTSNVMSDATNSTLVSAPSVDLSRGDVGRSTRAFMGYNVYRGGTLLNSQLVPTNYYEDIPPAVANYCYTVTAVYSLCGESDPSNQVCIDFHVGVETNDLSNVKVYPNPSNSILNIDLTDNVSQVVIYNFLGQVVYENNVTDDTRLKVNVSNYESGAYLVKFITNEGRTMTKKVVVTK